MDTTIAMRLMHLAADGLGLCEDALGELGGGSPATTVGRLRRPAR